MTKTDHLSPVGAGAGGSPPSHTGRATTRQTPSPGVLSPAPAPTGAAQFPSHAQRFARDLAANARLAAKEAEADCNRTGDRWFAGWQSAMTQLATRLEAYADGNPQPQAEHAVVLQFPTGGRAA